MFFSSLLNAAPGAIAQGMLWGIMAIGVYITYRILDVADLTVDGSLATGGAVCIMLMRSGCNPWIALLCAFLVALSGALLAQYQGAVDVNMGRGAIVIGLAAVIIGEVLLDKIFRNFALKLCSVVVGAVIYYLVLQIVLQLGLNTNDLKLFTAAIVALFLSIPYWKNSIHVKKEKGGARNA